MGEGNILERNANDWHSLSCAQPNETGHIVWREARRSAIEAASVDESEDREIAICRYSFSRDVDIQVQPVDVRHLRRITVVVQGMLQELELEFCSLWKSKNMWSVERVSRCIQMGFMYALPVRCGVDGVVLRVFFHVWRRETVGQGRILQSQESCYMFTIGITNNVSN
jgi:hypothetical protein